jgi:UDP-N-acetylglucosamine 2-epimerase
MRLVSIVGARPQFVKLAVVCQALKRCVDFAGWRHTIVHTGQHYDASLSGVFFEELAIPRPDYDLEVGSGSHASQTADMMKGLEPVLAAEKPDWTLLYGDTNSTLAGALVAAKASLPIAHIEAGLRSYRRGMPEEINRVAADHLSDLLLCPTELAMENLRKEGLGERAVWTGDVMLDASRQFRLLAESRGSPLAQVWLPGEFALATVHRAENTDDGGRLLEIVGALEAVAREVCPVVWPLHPRTRKRLSELGIAMKSVSFIEPVSYLDMLLLEGRARFILTDSGGVQKEAYFSKVPCITLRDETEWRETLANGCNVLTGANRSRVLKAVAEASEAGPWNINYGGGDAATAILSALARKTPGAARL